MRLEDAEKFQEITFTISELNKTTPTNDYYASLVPRPFFILTFGGPGMRSLIKFLPEGGAKTTRYFTMTKARITHAYTPCLCKQ